MYGPLQVSLVSPASAVCAGFDGCKWAARTFDQQYRLIHNINIFCVTLFCIRLHFEPHFQLIFSAS